MVAIDIKNLTKSFRKSTVASSHTTFKSELMRWVRGQRRPKPAATQVLKGIDLTIPRGCTYGIIGRNGSGKSTLLKLITGIYSPTTGSLNVHGRVSALLELGAGFHPDFSGRENILINGIILGMSHAEVKGRMQAIIDFAELGDFIDEPVRTYSSGMFMRLAFAVATHVDPDILIVDEILAVGDEHFARKSMAKMNEFKDSGKTIVLVTHDLATVQRWCDAAVWLEAGRIAAQGAPADVIDRYRRTVAEEEMAARASGAAPAAVSTPDEKRPPTPDAAPDRWGTFDLELSAVRLLDREGAAKTVFDTEDALSVELDFFCRRPVTQVVFGIAMFDGNGSRVYGTNTLVERVPLPTPLPARGTLRLELLRLGFLDGNYSLDVAAHSPTGENYDYHRGRYRLAVRSSVGDIGTARPLHRWSLDTENGEVARALTDSSKAG
ncbi:MAG: ABC transporter ATP-binding protein [Myxococcota bacterium]